MPKRAAKRRKLNNNKNNNNNINNNNDINNNNNNNNINENCPYLDTINRNVLDFDFEKLCSVSLTNLNVYACLVCGKYYQGRGKSSHAYFHSLEYGHHVFINLENKNIYCLPENYEVIDNSLDDIKFNLHPYFNQITAENTLNNKHVSHGLDGLTYLPGAIGLNNIKLTDWFNVVIQSLCRVQPLMKYFLVEDNYQKISEKSNLIKHFGELVCKYWNPKNFRNHVSPHELLQVIAHESKRKFRIGYQSDPFQFLTWFLNRIHKYMRNKKAHSSSIIHQCFQGEIEMITRIPKIDAELQRKVATEEEIKKGVVFKGTGAYESTSKKPFLLLSLDLPDAPLFKDTQDRSLIPQVSLFSLLEKFNGKKETLLADGSKRIYSMVTLPKYLIIHYKRFNRNNWFMEKNQTLVNFPLALLDMKPYMKLSQQKEEFTKMSITELKDFCQTYSIDLKHCIERQHIIEAINNYIDHLKTKYNLVANICHEGTPDSGAYKCHILHKSTNIWYEIQDLNITTSDTMPQLIGVSEAYIQIYELI